MSASRRRPGHPHACPRTRGDRGTGAATHAGASRSSARELRHRVCVAWLTDLIHAVPARLRSP